MLNLLDRLLLPEDEKPESVRNHQLRLSLVACASILTLTLVVLPAMFIGWLNLGQLAWANDVAKEVDNKVEAAVKPIKEQVDRIEAQVEQQTADTGEVIVGLLASELRGAAATRCLAPAWQRERENRKIEELQRKYKIRTGGEYDIPSCNEL